MDLALEAAETHKKHIRVHQYYFQKYGHRGKIYQPKRARAGIKFLDHKYLQSSNNQRLHTLFKTYLLKSFEDIQCTEDVLSVVSPTGSPICKS